MNPNTKVAITGASLLALIASINLIVDNQGLILEWNQLAPTIELANSYKYEYQVNDGELITLENVECRQEQEIICKSTKLPIPTELINGEQYEVVIRAYIIEDGNKLTSSSSNKVTINNLVVSP